MTFTGEYGGLVIYEQTDQQISESTSGAETTKQYDVVTKDGSVWTTFRAYDTFAKWLLATEPFDEYGNKPQKTSFQLDTKSAGNHWVAQITWGPEQGDKNNRNELQKLNIKYSENFSTKGGRVKRNVAYQQLRWSGSSWGDDYTQMIGAQGEGVEIDAPTLAFRISDRFRYDWMTTQRKIAIANITGMTVNDDVFLGYPAGTVRFLGADANLASEYEGEWGEIDGVPYQIPTFYWDVTYEFAVSGGRTETAADGTTIQLPPWWHLWTEPIEEDETIDAQTGRSRLVSKVGEYHAAQVYYPADYSVLGLE